MFRTKRITMETEFQKFPKCNLKMKVLVEDNHLSFYNNP